ncbi:lytic transglycosylase domain-containing protein [Shewanella intestini]|uniref:Lytic transglycosylase domain-containing protein n=2 Tax=Shewanellaceae TaxID=267890 RepID=A0ABS5I6H5_9GAMM|nr:lytic transglycosylase domain-containing protein [Shewanella intestini]MBR9729628.1 lytic transglycosylase domain-containing protein [Shewanella intestini]MRG37701.1 transglycosylase SLT domain-containing protein [Shewanella sp. XMDDZSB0408]
MVKLIPSATSNKAKTAQSPVLTNDYPLPQESRAKKPKQSYKARYSEHGIVDDIGVEKRRVYQYTNDAGITVFSDNPPVENSYQVLLYQCFACRPDSTIDWYHIALNTKSYKAFVDNAAKQHHIDSALIRAVIHAESAFKSQAVSRVGAKGLMQLMPLTAKDMGVLDALNPADNINGGSRYLAKMLKQFNNNVELACAAYNAGPSNVAKYQGVPPFPETQAYVKRVQILYQRYKKAL